MEDVEQVLETVNEADMCERVPDPGVEQQIEIAGAEEARDWVVAEESPSAAETDVFIAQAVVQPPLTAGRELSKAIIEAVIYVTEEPLSAQQISAALDLPLDQVKQILSELAADYGSSSRGLCVRELAGGYKMATKPEHHDAIRRFVKRLQPPLKLSMAALETLAVVAYKQPITGPEILDIRGVQGAGVLKTLLDRKLIATAGRKDVLGKPIMYKTTREFLVQFGLNSLAELPTLKEFEELGRLSLVDEGENATVEVPATTGEENNGHIQQQSEGGNA
jgi:segregation and condensation protein B